MWPRESPTSPPNLIRKLGLFVLAQERRGGGLLLLACVRINQPIKQKCNIQWCNCCTSTLLFLCPPGTRYLGNWYLVRVFQIVSRPQHANTCGPFKIETKADEPGFYSSSIVCPNPPPFRVNSIQYRPFMRPYKKYDVPYARLHRTAPPRCTAPHRTAPHLANHTQPFMIHHVRIRPSIRRSIYHRFGKAERAVGFATLHRIVPRRSVPQRTCASPH